MNYKPKLNWNNKRHAAFIYTVVFNGRFSVILILLLFASFAVQPIHQAYANELLNEEVDIVEEPVAEDVIQSEIVVEVEDESLEVQVEAELTGEDINTFDVDEGDVSDDGVAADSQSDSTGSLAGENPDILTDFLDDGMPEDNLEESPAENSTEQSSTTPPVIQANTNSTSTDVEFAVDESESVSATTTNSFLEDTSTTTVIESSPDQGEESQDNSSSSNGSSGSNDDTDDRTSSTTLGEEESASQSNTNEVVGDDIDDAVMATTTSTTEVSTTTEESVQTTVVDAQTLTTESNYYQFNRQACVAIGDGTYHCSVNTGLQYDSSSVVYSEMGANLNMEIFLRTSDGEIEQLTDNVYDDTSPHFDAETMSVVWQRLIDDRYQIVIFDLEDREERQITFSRTNNMEPKIAEAGIVWQAWDGNDWEVMYFDGTFTDQITDNSTQDVAPAIDDGYILWTVLGTDEQEAKVYSLTSGETLNITGYEGGIIANPRFVLVYDTKFENGDIITQGFDPDTGLSKPISAQPADEPVEIPDTDSTGETRALIQNKSSQKDESEISEDGNNSASSTSDGVPATSEPETTLDLNTQTATSTTDSATELATSTDDMVSDVLELTDFDLILIDTPTTTDDLIESPDESIASST